MKNSSARLNQFLINRLIFFMIHIIICSSFYMYMVCTNYYFYMSFGQFSCLTDVKGEDRSLDANNLRKNNRTSTKIKD